ncbi:hypothetical protein PENTCL1PPCAC_5186, partial [Pristionchus entomophagus]
MPVRNFVQLSYGIPGILSYFLAFYAMFGVRRFLSRNFVVVYVLMAVFNMLTWLNILFFMKLSNEPFFFFYYEWLIKIPALTNIQSFLSYHFYYAQNISVFLFIIDRFVAIFSVGK